MTCLESPSLAAAPPPAGEPVSPGRYFVEALWPAMGWARLFLVLVVLKAASYWLISKWQHPHDPPSVTAMYRIADTGDIGYYPVISGFSRLNLGERTIYEHAGKGMASFPLASLVPHALAFRLFGWPGLILVDLVAVLGFYLIFAVLLRIMGVPEAVSYCVSLLIVAGVWLIVPHVIPHFPLVFWDLRIPRPLITDAFLAIGVGLVSLLLNDEGGSSRRLWWFALGLAFAALVQGEIYLAMSMAVLIAVLVGFLFIRDYGVPGAWARRAVDVVALGAGTALAGLPFLMQRLLENKEAARRLGVFPIPRGHLLFLPGRLPYLLVAAVVALGALDLILLRREGAAEGRLARERNILMLVVFSVASLLVLPLSGVLLGKGIQLYHFEDAVVRICSLALLILSLYLAGRRRWLQEGGSWVTPVVWGIMAISLIVSGLLGYGRSARHAHIRADFAEYAALPDYRAEFTKLTEELSSPKYDGLPVLGTFDHQLYAWWVTFRAGYSLLPDPFYTTLADDEIESRLIRFCHELGMSSAQFSDFLDRKYVNALWLGHCKYSVSKAYTLRPLDEYDPAVREEIGRTTILDAGSVMAIPRSEKERMLAKYRADSTAPASEKLDVIVLLNDPSTQGASPPAAEYRESYRNALFRVFLRKPPVLAAGRLP